jgi:hypothetical protein
MLFIMFQLLVVFKLFLTLLLMLKFKDYQQLLVSPNAIFAKDEGGEGVSFGC